MIQNQNYTANLNVQISEEILYQIWTFLHQKCIFKVISMSFDQLNQTFVLNHY